MAVESKLVRILWEFTEPKKDTVYLNDLRDQLKSFFLELVGEDEDTNPLGIWEELYYIRRNDLRAELRDKIRKQ